MELSDIVKDNHIVVCAHNDALKVKGEYKPMFEHDVLQCVEYAEHLGYDVSHGICPSCYEATIKTLRGKNEYREM